MISDEPEPAGSVEPQDNASVSTVRRLLFGDDGLRAGWSLLLFLFLLAGLSSIITFLLFHFHVVAKPVRGAAPVELTPRVVLLQDGVGFVCLALSAWLMSLLERRPFHRYGLTLRRAAPDLLLGLGWGFAFLSALVGLLRLTHYLAFEGTAVHGSLAWSYGLKWAMAFLCVGLYEEFLFRGYLQYTVARGFAGIARAMSLSSPHTYAAGFAISALLFSGILFSVTHLGNGGETAAGIVAVGLAGAVFAFSLWRTASLWWAVGFHAAWDWAQTFFYGTPDSGLRGVGHLFSTHAIGDPRVSGGSDGPEGSLLVIPTLLFVLVVIHFTLPFRPRFLTPDQSSPVEIDCP